MLIFFCVWFCTPVLCNYTKHCYNISQSPKWNIAISCVFPKNMYCLKIMWYAIKIIILEKMINKNFNKKTERIDEKIVF